ncbi:TIGR02452 family protein [Kineosporia sp. NBRC 101677]|uniref:TIGR02452 family protein n=1 Tax=Kineosporia sp. NBRC 101677 TaxID=3032197 RepID=UPI0024A11C3D|nr:TIGR02452 family protein [Kineosporia sp. NBRC 101677]GLY17178.1 TIGR02452 family protein [Kineosporia sp. NBRC 101677]
MRNIRKAMAEETVGILERGTYSVDGREVDIRGQVTAAVTGTVLYVPDDALAAPAVPARKAEVTVTNETSLSAAQQLGHGVACLNFASARNPGGGFLNGSQAQEESLARSSALYACLRPVEGFYGYHRRHPELTYSDRVIYSPDVPVVRDDDGNLLAKPYLVSFLTSAAPNRAALTRQQPALLPSVAEILQRRAARVLAVAAAHGHRRIVLGAWGCGVFGNDPTVVAEAFALALDRGPWFDEVVFAVLDHHRGTPTYAAFADVFS